MKNQNLYQYALIGFALLVVLGIGAFIYRELFPEYKKYQYAYDGLEKFRSSYTHEPPAPFSKGIKQILLPQSSGGPELIDRCTSCHVAVDLPHFSPTRLALDVNDKHIYDDKGNPVLEPNPDYVWTRLDRRIDELRSPIINEVLAAENKEAKLRKRLKEADLLARLKTIEIEGKQISVEKVIQMHPLMPGETRPFQYHPMAEYGCSTCHSGNGRSLVAKRAHGPVYDGDYDPFYPTAKPQFTEVDPKNDPAFSRMYNDKPGHDLIFQTTPILAGPMIVANCVQCHQGASTNVKAAIDKFSYLSEQKQEQLDEIQKGIENEKAALESLKKLRSLVQEKGRDGAIEFLGNRLQESALSSEEIDALKGQLAFLQDHEEAAFDIEAEIGTILQSTEILLKQKSLQHDEALLREVQLSQDPLELTLQNPAVAQSLSTTVDTMIAGYHRGKELFISQACYACHKIAGYSRASVGPELTKEGNSYPWYVKESIVWPQADLPSSSMPNFRLDHDELADLMTFVMAQKGGTKAVSQIDYKIELTQWEKGKKMPWEKPVAPSMIDNVRAGQIVFASEGCAACHKLQGFET
ncbi:c-type cytochrome, partial [Chlamydiota bacterium]